MFLSGSPFILAHAKMAVKKWLFYIFTEANMRILRNTILVASALFSAATQAAEIELINAFNMSSSRYGMTSYSESFSVYVDKLSEDQTVFVRQESLGGGWVDIPMLYSGDAGSNKAIYTAYVGERGIGKPFAVATRANGETYWDNNNGQNYEMTGEGNLLGNGKKVIVKSYFEDSTYDPELETLRATIVLDNIAAEKTVHLTYSVDNWATSTTVDARYAGPYVSIGYGSYPNPSASGAEEWNVTTHIPKDVRGEFFITYSVSGNTYYASNYGRNYVFNYDSLYPSMHVRKAPSWDSGQPMRLLDDNLWYADVYFSTEGDEFKFDVYNDWTVNFGDNEADGIADSFGANIVVQSENSRARVIFNEITNEYSVNQ